MNKDVRSHESISEQYVDDYLSLIYNKYAPFQNMLFVDYYQLDVQNSNINDDMSTFYKNVSDVNFGGRFKLIIDVPVMFSTNNVYTDEATEKGMAGTSSTKITAIMDPVINIVPKIGDMLAFQFKNGYYGVYKIENIDDSATLEKRYSRINISMEPQVDINHMKKFVIDTSIFIQEYHKVVNKERGIMIIKIRDMIPKLINELNSYYHKSLDFHNVQYDAISLDYDKCLNFLNYAFEGLILTGKLKTSGTTRSCKKVNDLSPMISLCMPYKDYTTETEIFEVTKFNELRDKVFLGKRTYYSTSKTNEPNPLPFNYTRIYFFDVLTQNVLTESCYAEFVNRLASKSFTPLSSNRIFNQPFKRVIQQE
jgi:hypothetical protein